MATYLETQTRIANELNRSNLTAEIKLAILSAIDYYAIRRWHWNENISIVYTVSGSKYVNLPSDYIELDILKVISGSSTIRLIERDYETLFRWSDAQANSGRPTDFTKHSDLLVMYPTPDAVYSLKIYYIAKLAALSADADTNAWLTYGEELIRTHAKKDLYINKIRDTNAAKDMQAMEDSILLRLESHQQRRNTSGRTKAFYL